MVGCQVHLNGPKKNKDIWEELNIFSLNDKISEHNIWTEQITPNSQGSIHMHIDWEKECWVLKTTVGSVCFMSPAQAFWLDP